MTSYRTLTSTAHSRELGGELRRAREATGATAFDFARKLGWHQSRISRIETGKLDPSEVEVAIYLTNCGVSGDELNRVLDLATESCDGFWYRKHDQRLPDELRSLVIQENTAAAITAFELTRVPGLLQEEQYARAIISMGVVSPAGIEPRVEARMARQSLLKQRDAPSCLFYIHEQALQLPVGGTEVMRHQIWHLLMASSSPRCAIRVIPIVAGAHAGMAGPFRLMEFYQEKPIVYVENETCSLFLEEKEHIDSYRQVLRQLHTVALDEGESREWLADLVSGYD